jgi:hypothetical protein
MFQKPLSEVFNSPKINILYGLRKCLLTLRNIDLVENWDTMRNNASTLPKWLMVHFYFKFLSKLNKIFYLAICFRVVLNAKSETFA